MNNTFTRRQLLKSGLAGIAGTTFVKPFGSLAFSAPLLSAPKAKSVIQIWMWGGPTHLDTFDPKPQAGSDYTGPLDKTAKTNIDGIEIGQLLPLLAQQADKYSLIRTMTHGINSHETASYLVQTGHKVGRLVYPSVGAVVSQFKGYDHGYKGIVPPYIVLTEAQGRFSEAGFLGPKAKPFVTGGDPAKTPFMVEGIVARGITDQRQKQRRDLMHDLDLLGRASPATPEFDKLDLCEQNAYDMLFGQARNLFDLASEDDKLRDDYGRNTFGQSCLMARKLVEHGVPYVTINYKGWDTHKQHFEIMNRKLPELDAGLSSLLKDLSSKGLLDSTIIWCGGEFGRTPKVQWDAPWNGGRSHFGPCFSTFIAGGGFKPGIVVGTSNSTGTEVKDNPVYPPDLIRAIYTKLGIDPDSDLTNPRALDVKVMAPSENKSADPLKEIV